jgi:hypothetical protein
MRPIPIASDRWVKLRNAYKQAYNMLVPIGKLYIRIDNVPANCKLPQELLFIRDGLDEGYYEIQRTYEDYTDYQVKHTTLGAMITTVWDIYRCLKSVVSYKYVDSITRQEREMTKFIRKHMEGYTNIYLRIDMENPQMSFVEKSSALTYRLSDLIIDYQRIGTGRAIVLLRQEDGTFLTYQDNASYIRYDNYIFKEQQLRRNILYKVIHAGFLVMFRLGIPPFSLPVYREWDTERINYVSNKIQQEVL